MNREKIRYILAHDDEIEDNHAPARGLVWGAIYGGITWAVCIVLLLLHLSAADAATVTAFKVREFTQGNNKTCVYSALGNEYYRTYSAMEFCPLSIQVVI